VQTVLFTRFVVHILSQADAASTTHSAFCVTHIAMSEARKRLSCVKPSSAESAMLTLADPFKTMPSIERDRGSIAQTPRDLLDISAIASDGNQGGEFAALTNLWRLCDSHRVENHR